MWCLYEVDKRKRTLDQRQAPQTGDCLPLVQCTLPNFQSFKTYLVNTRMLKYNLYIHIITLGSATKINVGILKF